MRPRNLIACLLTIATFAGPVRGGEGLLTVAERSGFQATARGEEVMDLCERLAKRSGSVRLDELGRTVEGRPIPLLIVAEPPIETAAQARTSGKILVLLVGNIHAGEVCGKEALLMLVRELTNKPGHPLLEDLILAVVPNYNADGNDRFSPDNRPGQNGPEQGMGQRRNAQGLDLNRDFMKLDAPETRAMVRFLDHWDPHLVIDTHATNGSAHRFSITYEGPKNPATHPDLLEFSRRRMLPEVAERFHEATGQHAYYYGNFDGSRTRWETYPAEPRYFTTYVGLRQRLSVLSEAYAYDSYEDRVRNTLAFVRAHLEFSAKNGEPIRSLLDHVRSEAIASREPIPIRSEPVPGEAPATILGFVENEEDGRWIATDEWKDYEVTPVLDFKPTCSVDRPFAYVLPPDFGAIAENLRRHGIALDLVREDIDLDVEQARIVTVQRSAREFEGHRLVRVEVTSKPTSRRVEAGSFLVRTAQPHGALAAYLLEPESDDGLCTWGAFDVGLEPGEDFPVLRLVEPISILTTPLPAPVDDQERDKPITFDAIEGPPSRSPDFSGSPVTPRWLDGEHFLMVQDSQLRKVEAASGRSEPFHDPETLAEALEALPTIDRAAARSLARRNSFNMDPDHKGALFNYQGDLYYATFDGSKAVRLTSHPGLEELTEFSPDGRFVAFVRDNDLHVVDLETQTERALTTGGTDLVRNGKAVWVYFEELFSRSWKSYWWSPDSKHIAYLQMDDSPLEPHTVLDDVGPRRTIEQTPYPWAGDPNPLVKLGIVPVGGGAPRFADLSIYLDGSFLISHVGWFPEGEAALCYVQDRTQTWLDVLRVSPSGGKPRKLFRETTEAWVESPGDPHFLDHGSFLWLSERDGWKHLYHYKTDGTLVEQVSEGEWEVRRVHHVDEDAGYVYFQGTKDSPIAQNLYRLALESGAVERLTEAEGDHSVSMAPDGKHYVDRWSSIEAPIKVALYRADGDRIRMLDANPVPALEEYRFGPRELVQIETEDGFVLEGELILPPDLDESKRYPVWFTTYGGPHTPTVSNSWAGGRSWDQALAQEGFIVFRVDPRPASGKGAVSAWSAYKRLGIQELEDIKEAIEWLKQKPFVDGSRIGMTGHSYGGYMTTFAMTHSDLFACGIAGAPVTDWRNYDTIYTERFMLTPQENPEGYAETSVVEAAGDLEGRLLIVHGAKDDNVSLRNTYRLIQALQSARKDFELMIYPEARHGIPNPHYNKLRLDFIRRTLGGGPTADDSDQ